MELYGGRELGKIRKAVLLEESLSVETEKVFGTTEESVGVLALRNVEKVEVRQYWIDIESYYRKGQDLRDIEQLEVDLVEADKMWEIVIPDYQRYEPMKHKVAIPFGDRGAGVCVIKVGSGELESTTVVLRSDLELMVRAGS